MSRLRYVRISGSIAAHLKKFSWKFLKVGNSKKALFTREKEFGVSFKFNNTIDSEMNENAEFRGYDNHLKTHQS